MKMFGTLIPERLLELWVIALWFVVLGPILRHLIRKLRPPAESSQGGGREEPRDQ